MSTIAVRTRFFLFLFLLFSLAIAPSLRAQGLDAYFGLGTATDSAAPNLSVTNPDGSISSFPRQTMGGVFGLFGADFMITPHLGFGGEYAFRFAQANYLPDLALNARPSFYDFNAVYQPLKETMTFVPVFQAGLGGAKVSYYADQQTCDLLTGCSSANTLVDQANHFQLHFSGGVKWHLTESIFIRPQVDVHWVNNYNDVNAPVYGRNWVPQFTVAIGYTIGAH
jgi:hypothetical protein